MPAFEPSFDPAGNRPDPGTKTLSRFAGQNEAYFDNWKTPKPYRMNKRFEILAWLASLSFIGHAAVPTPEKLLPAETLGVFTVPDCAKARAAYDANAGSQLWRDPALKPFKDKLVGKINDEFIKPLERELGVKFEDYRRLAQGQLTFAVLQNGWQGKEDPLPAWMLLIDAKDKSSQLKTNLADLRKKWIDSGRKLKTEKIRDVEFTTLTVSAGDVAKTLAKSLSDSKQDSSKEKLEESKPGSKASVTMGQSESLLIVGSDANAIEKILARQSGGALQPLSEQTAFAADYQARFRNALAYGWVHFRPISDVLSRLASDAGDKNKDSDSPDPSKIISAAAWRSIRGSFPTPRRSAASGSTRPGCRAETPPATRTASSTKRLKPLPPVLVLGVGDRARPVASASSKSFPPNPRTPTPRRLFRRRRSSFNAGGWISRRPGQTLKECSPKSFPRQAAVSACSSTTSARTRTPILISNGNWWAIWAMT